MDGRTETADDYTETKPHHILKQVESVQNAYYDKADKFSGHDTDDFDSKLNTFRSKLGINAVGNSVWVRAFPIILTGRALVFFQTSI